MRIRISSFVLIAFLSANADAQTSSLVSLGGGGKLQYQPYANWGQTNAVNTIPDFSFAGYKGGGVPLPVVPVAETVDPVSGDARAVIQAAIDRVSALPKDANGIRGAVLLKSGEYFVEGSLQITADGVVLRGEGQNTVANGGTEIVATARAQHSLIKLIGAETAGRNVAEVVLDTKQYPAQNTILDFNVFAGVASELEGDKLITFHIFTNANQYTNYGSREDTVFRRPVLQLTVRSAITGADSTIELLPVADAYVRGGIDSVNNFGGEVSLAIKYSGDGAANTREGYLKFDLSSIADTLTQAVLKMYAKYDLTQPTVTIPVLYHSVSFVGDDSWEETTITYANRPKPAATDPVQRITTSYVPTGATSFAISDATGLTVGDPIKVVRTPNDFWINTLDMAQYGWVASYYRIKYERVITAIEGNTITVDIPIVQAMEDQFGGGEVYKEAVVGRLQNSGVENLLLSSVYSSEEDEQHGWIAIQLTQTDNCWVQNVTARYFGYSCVMLDWAFNTTVQNCAMLDPKSITTGGRKYSFYIDKGSFNLFQRCFTRGGRHDYVTGSQVAGPNVFVDCAAVQTYADIGPHHRYATGVLFDNINGGETRVQNRKDMGTGHGWAGAQTMFWNCISNTGEFKVESPIGAMNWGIGGYGVLKLGAGFWEQYGTTVAPRSLYFQQLQDRLGTTALENVTLLRQRQGPIWSQLVSWGGFGDLSAILSDASEGEEMPDAYALFQNYPNPFNPRTQFGMRIAEPGMVKLSVYDLLGREVAVLVDEEMAPGFHSMSWDGRGISSGIYLYRITARSASGTRFTDTKTMVLLK